MGYFKFPGWGGAPRLTTRSTPTPAPTPAPNAPSTLTATGVSTPQINLSWTDNSTNEAGFSIESCQGGGCQNFAPIAQVGPNTTSYSNTGLSPGTRYRYRVRA